MNKREYRKRIIKIIVALKTRRENRKFSIELSSFINELYRKFSDEDMVKAIFISLHPYLNDKIKKIEIDSNLEKNLNLLIGGLNNELYYKRNFKFN